MRHAGPTVCGYALVPMNLIQVEREDLLSGQQLLFHISVPGMRPGEDTPASRQQKEKHGKQQSTGYKPQTDWHRERCQGLLPTVGETIRSHWTATACLKLGSPQSVRCRPATVCLPHRVYED
jgi:hypothetical protein